MKIVMKRCTEDRERWTDWHIVLLNKWFNIYIDIYVFAYLGG